MLVLAVLAGMATATPSLIADAPPGTRPGRVVLAAEPLRARAGDPAVDALVLVVEAVAAGALDASGATRSDDDDRAIAASLARARAIELRGGTWLGWYQAAHAGRHERAWTRALRRAHESGAEVRASGAAAAWVAGWSPVPRAVVGKPAQDPHDLSLDLALEGLGLCDVALVGVLVDGAPTADRAVERALNYGFRDVLLLAGTAELAWDPSARTIAVRLDDGGATPGWLAWIDAGAATRSRDSVRGARATLPRDGDAFELHAGELRPVALSNEPAPEPDASPLVQRLVAELGAGGATAPAVRGIRCALDERTRRTSGGGIFGLRIDLELATPR